MSFNFNPNAAAGGGGTTDDLAILEQLAYDHRDRYPYHHIPPSINTTSLTTMSQAQANRQSLSLSPGTSWLPLDMTGAVGAPVSFPSPASATASSPEDIKASSSAASSPLQHQPSPYQSAALPNVHAHSHAHAHAPGLLPDWSMPQHAMPMPEVAQFIHNQALMGFNPFNTAGFHASPVDYLPATTRAAMDASMGLDAPFSAVSPVEGLSSQAAMEQLGMGMGNWSDFQAAINFQAPDGMGARMSSIGSHSPTGTYLEVLSLPSSDGGWAMVDTYQNFETYQQSQQQPSNTAIFNPGQTLHLRTSSDTSDANAVDFGSNSSNYEETSAVPYSPFSSDSDGFVDVASNHRFCSHDESHQHHHHQHSHSHEVNNISPSAVVAPMPIKASSSSSNTQNRSSPTSGPGSVSPPARKNLGPRKSPIAKATKATIRRTPTVKKDGTTEKRVGRRRGPLLPEQRKQASEIRKLRACLRCKFLKKTCDKGEPCAGCQPSHARLWQVPCTRIDIKDINYFMKDWKADYERHQNVGMSVYNVKGFAQKESLMWISHGYGICLPVMVREVFVTDDRCFQVDWVESHLQDQDPIEFEIRTQKLDIGQEGISMEALSEYVDKHVDDFERFVDDHFEGTPFITEILKTAHRFYNKEKVPVIGKALKLIVAYNLTVHITMIEQGNEDTLEGQIDDEDSKYYGKTVAPVMVNFQIKCAMADLWRDLQKDILEELSALYSSVYSGDRLKNWPTIFMLASILLAVWEEMQFDCHFRVPSPDAVEKFCSDMETTPVGVIIGLFHAISQKLPALTEWDTRRHGQLLNNNTAVCDAMTEVRQHVIKHESYLRSRPESSKFDRFNFDSLSNKFLSKLVIKAN